jgi:predicted ATPase/DNA-binding CsgD family transcriptional regulator
MPPPNNLPVRRAQLIGREQEVAAVRRFLLRDDDDNEIRLLTLTGPAGIGKTRLSLRVGADLLDAAQADKPDIPAFPFQDGIFFVPLDTVRDPALVPRTIAQALGVHEASDRPVADSLREHLHDKRLLLILDNFEQVTAAAPLLSELLGAAGHLKLLVTSRALLHLYAEQDFPVPPLELPPESPVLPTGANDGSSMSPERLTGYASARLFVERAASVRPGFAITPDNAVAVAEICRRLDGLPLAIELAAARTRILPPQAMLDRLRNRVQNRLDLLTGGARNLPPRQQTLRDAITWSYDLLSGEEQRLFRWLSVFVGGCTFQAVETVASGLSILDIVESLLNKSLLRQEETGEGESRFYMLPILRDYATEQLQESGEAEEVWRRYAGYYVRLAEEAERQLTGPGQSEWLDRLETEHGNLRATLHWAESEGDIESGLLLSGLLLRFWDHRGYLTEGREHTMALLARSDTQQASPTAGYARALNAAAVLAYRQSDIGAARQLHERGLAVSRQIDDRLRIARSLNGLAHVNRVQGNLATARTLLEEALVISRELGDKWNLAAVLANLGLTAGHDEDKTAALLYYKESLAISRELGDKSLIATTLGYMGLLARRKQDYAEAHSLFEEALSVHRDMGDKHAIAMVLGVLGELAYVQGDYASVAGFQEGSLAIARELDDKWAMASALENLSQLARLQGNFLGAARFLVEALSLRRELGQAHGATGALSEAAGLLSDLGMSEPWREALEPQRRATDAERGLQDTARLLGAVEGIVKTTGKPLVDKELIDHNHNMEIVREKFEETAFAEAMSEGQALSLAQAFELALEPLERLLRPTGATSEASEAAPQSTAQKPPDETYPEGLTGREVEVLRLLVAGKSNPTIAAELYLSTNTVQAHLRSVYNKIGVASRAEATRYALEHNLA